MTYNVSSGTLNSTIPYYTITGCASRNESSSGCVLWRTIVCMAQHRRTCLTACGRHQRSSVVDVSALLAPRHVDATSSVDSSSYPRRPHFSGGCSACNAWNSLPLETSGLLLTFDISERDQVSPFSSVIWLTWRRLLR